MAKPIKQNPIAKSFPVSKDTWEPLEKRLGVVVTSRAKIEPKKGSVKSSGSDFV